MAPAHHELLPVLRGWRRAASLAAGGIGLHEFREERSGSEHQRSEIGHDACGGGPSQGSFRTVGYALSTDNGTWHVTQNEFVAVESGLDWRGHGEWGGRQWHRSEED